MNPNTVMTPEEQQIAIAGACGWTKIDRYIGQEKTPEGLLKGLKPKRKAGKKEKLPDYLNDLNAMREAEKLLLPDLSRYGMELTKVCDQFAARNGYELLESWRTTAIAAQRAEAFLKTLKLWEDDV